MSELFNLYTIIGWLVIWGILGAVFGATKGRVGDGIIWALLLGPIGLIIVLCLTSKKELDKKGTKKCPYCAERIKKEAKVCKFCHKGVETVSCPSCNAKIYKPEGSSGSTCDCPSCSAPFVMP